MFFMILLVAVLSIPMLYIKNEYPHLRSYFYMMSFFVVSSIIFFICYWYMFKKSYGGGIKNFVKYTGTFFTFFSLAMGFSLHNTIAVLEGHLGKKSEFVRTPKFNINNRTKHDASISSGLAIMACNKNRYTPVAKKEYKKIDLGIKRYDNTGTSSKIIR